MPYYYYKINFLKQLIEMLKKRSQIYSKALYEIKCDRLSKNEIVNGVLKIYENH